MIAPSPRPQRKSDRPSSDTAYGTPKCSEMSLAPDVYMDEARELCSRLGSGFESMGGAHTLVQRKTGILA